jgi:integrase
VLVTDLTRDMLAKWLSGVAAAKPSLGPAKQDRTAGDAARAGRATANRTLAILRAAMNDAFRAGRVGSDASWRSLRPFRDAGASRLRYFTKDECWRLVNAAQGSFRPLLQAALFTGCRYGELGRLRVGDFNLDSGTVFVSESKSGKSRHVVLTDEARRFFSTLTAGRPTDDIMLSRDGGGPWGPSNAIVRMTRTMAGQGSPAVRFIPYGTPRRRLRSWVAARCTSWPATLAIATHAWSRNTTAT